MTKIMIIEKRKHLTMYFACFLASLVSPAVESKINVDFM